MILFLTNKFAVPKFANIIRYRSDILNNSKKILYDRCVLIWMLRAIITILVPFIFFVIAHKWVRKRIDNIGGQHMMIIIRIILMSILFSVHL